ncbi:unnamed protein product [Lymnaea stagnalis]|uniref:Major facilitator superfamily (MFS) profile domain-containing protein n=1 Tax=Lymnaea stagnalis TaxID=6523 RepID=A0AAV2II97_LYMST
MNTFLSWQDQVEALIYVNIVVSLMIIAFFAIGPISVFWVMLSELFPHSARGTGLNIAILCTMLGFFSHCYIFPLLLSKLHSYTFFVFCGVDLLMAIFVYFYVPETKNKTFAEIAKSWAPVKSLENPLALSTSYKHETTFRQMDSTVYNHEQTDGQNTQF